MTEMMTPISEPKNLDFEEGYRYWGTKWPNSIATDFSKLFTENDNTYVTLTPKADDGGNGCRGIITALDSFMSIPSWVICSF